MSRIVYLDGVYRPENEAAIPPDDMGVLYGLGSFETIRLYSGVPFLAERHEVRLRGTLIWMQVSPPPFDLSDILARLSQLNSLPDARGRLMVTGGVERHDGSPGKPHVFAEVAPLPPETPEGVAVRIVEGALDGLMPLPGVKSLSYLPNYIARREAREQGADEAILIGPDGELLEGATSNFFVVLGDTLVTPPADGRLLEGVTRGVVLEEAARLDLAVDLRGVRTEELDGATEAFLTSTVREIRPIVDFEGRRLEAPGPITRQIQDAYRQRVAAEVAAASTP